MAKLSQVRYHLVYTGAIHETRLSGMEADHENQTQLI